MQQQLPNSQTSDVSRSRIPGIRFAIAGALPILIVLILPTSVLRALVGEDSWVETAGALAWIGAALFFAATLFGRRSSRYSPVWLGALVLMTILAAGEEISWGQRYIGYATPELIEENNLQKEMNFHNLSFFDVRTSVEGEHKTGLARWLTFARIGALIWMGFLVALPILYRWVNPVRQFVDWLRVPVPPLRCCFYAAP